MRKFILILSFFYCGAIFSQNIPSDSLITTFMYDFENAINSGDSAYFVNHFDTDEFRKIVRGNYTIPENQNKIFEDATNLAAGLAIAIKAEIAKEGNYTFLKYYTVGDTIKAIYRLLLGDGRLNYHKYDILYSDENARIVDVYFYITGEYASRSIRNAIFPILQIDNSLIGKINYLTKLMMGDRNKYIEGLTKVKEIKNCIATGEFKKGIELFESLPDEIKNMKSARIYQITLTTNYSDSMAIKAIEEYSSLFPDDPSLSLLLIDYYFLKKDYKKSLENVDLLIRHLPEDGHLHVIKSNLLVQLGEIEKAVYELEQSIEVEPYYTNGYYENLNYLITVKNYPKLVTLLYRFKDYLGLYYTKEMMKNDQGFSEFIKSEEFKKIDPNYWEE